MSNFVSEIPYAVLVLGAVLVGLWVSNILYDLQVHHWISRKIAHSAGGMGFLLYALLFSSGWWPIILTSGFLALLWGARFIRPDTFRGVGGSGRKNTMSEIWFPLSAIPIIAIGWIWLDKPLVTVSCLLFMAWGDALTGIVRSRFVTKAQKHWSGSIAMFIACIIISWCFIPYAWWIRVAVSVIATIVEWSCGDVGLIKRADDNWAIPVVSAIFLFLVI